MAQYNTTFQAEQMDDTVFIAPGAVVVGDVSAGRLSSVWYNAVIRGDCEAISVGHSTNIQDGCVLHADPGVPCRLGDRVTVGHAAVVHGAQIANDVLIGMRAVVMNGASVGAGSIIGVGAVVTEGTIVPQNSLVLGIPGKIVRETTLEEREHIRVASEHYVEAAGVFRDNNA